MATHTTKSWFTGGGAAFNFVVPANVSLVFITAVGAGGGGGGSAGSGTAGNGGGSAGEFCRRFPLKVTPGGSVTGVTGTGGAGGVSGVPGSQSVLGAGQSGTNTTVTNGVTTITLHAGEGGAPSQAIGFNTHGGGVHPYEGISGNLQNGNPGRYEQTYFTAGGSGAGRFLGGGPGTAVTGGTGAPCEGFLGGGGGSKGTTPGVCPQIQNIQGGGGGASSIWGVGGIGGSTGSSNWCHVALCDPGWGCPPYPGVYGAGGGGAAGATNWFSPPTCLQGCPPGVVALPGGAGAPGAVLIEWISP